jgi:toxin ParE1/3/4
MNSYRLTPEAQGDVDGIADYIAASAGLDRALRVVSKIREHFRKLGDSPGLGHFKEDVVGKEFKFSSVYKYLIVYRWDQRPIQIVAIVHGARDLNAFLEDRLD